MRLILRPALLTPVLLAGALGGLAVLSPPVPALGADEPAMVLVSAEPASALPRLPVRTAYRVVPGQRIARQAWADPVRGAEVTARFGDASSSWSSGRHTGLDLAAPVGTPIRSVAAGEVLSTAYDGAYGARTVVRLDDGTEVWYCHQDSQEVAAGDRVAQGQVIGAVGATGNVTGPHLHLEIRPGGGDPVDPSVVLAGHRVEP